MISFTTQVQGLRELEQALHALPDKIAKRLMTRAGRAAGALFKEQLQIRAPRSRFVANREHGPLHDHMRIKVSFQGGPNWMTVQIGPDKTVSYYARFYEYGTIHQPARPFMRPAFDAQKQRAIEAFANSLRENLAQLKN